MSAQLFYGIGRHKSAIARVRLSSDTTEKTINGHPVATYLPTTGMQQAALSPLILTSQADVLGMQVKVVGGGKQGQAYAIRLGIARALVESNEQWRKQLKDAGMLTRDARVRERKKPGLKRARRAPQFSKR